MAPPDILDHHHKNLHSVDELAALAKHYGDPADVCLESFSVWLPPETRLFQAFISILLDPESRRKGEIDGKLIVEVESEGKQEAIAQITFSQDDVTHCKPLVANPPIQIISAFVDEHYRQNHIAEISYQALSKHFTVISDSHQTELGAGIWKFNLSKLENYDVQIIDQFNTHLAHLRLDEQGQPVIYNKDSEKAQPGIEATIWGLDSSYTIQPNKPEYFIVSKSESRSGVVLTLIPK